MGKPAVRITDPVQHILPPILTGGPVSPNVLIGGLPASLGGLIASLAARRQSIHACATPYPPIPHGPGVVVDGSGKVLINNLPACFQGNTIVEALGPANQISMGCPQVLIGTD
ncbi:MAG: hypothetical protein V9H25_13835 [Candidatus Competibacter sp.]|jgi:hypothetical protein